MVSPGHAAIAPAERLASFCERIFLAIGADTATARDATAAMMHGSVHGVDSHGVRLLPHYITVMRKGRVNPTPGLAFRQIRPGSGLLDADHAHGARAAYAAMDHACEMARQTGIAAVGVRHASHFGPAGAFTFRAAERGLIGIAVCNSDSFVRLHDGAAPFHGTNPFSMAVPGGGDHPWLLDMATSSVPYNRVQLYQSTGERLPPGVASGRDGQEITDPRDFAMLDPVGGAFGFKGAGLAGVAEILSAVLTGMRLSPEILPMGGPDLSTPRELGAFVIVLDPDGFVGAPMVRDGMTRYMALLRGSAPREGARVMAPGDREWEEAARRRARGIPLDPVTTDGMAALSAEFGIALPFDTA